MTSFLHMAIILEGREPSYKNRTLRVIEFNLSFQVSKVSPQCELWLCTSETLKKMATCGKKFSAINFEPSMIIIHKIEVISQNLQPLSITLLTYCIQLAEQNIQDQLNIPYEIWKTLIQRFSFNRRRLNNNLLTYVCSAKNLSLGCFAP